MRKTLRGWAAAGLGCALLTGAAMAQQQPGTAAQPGAAGQPAARPADNLGDRDLPGPIDSIQDLEDTGKMLFKLADTNNDGQISQKEATDAGDLLVGGFFFRADANGDGTLSREEAQSAREQLLRQKPMLRFVLQRGSRAVQAEAGNNPNARNAANPAASIGSLLDTNGDKKLEATELRQAVQSTVQGMFAAADTNRDGQMSPAEINAGILGAARTGVRAAFQAADADNNGQVSQPEFDKAIVEPGHVVFAVIDLNGDGQLSPQELDSVARFIASQMRGLQVPEAPNSPGNMIRTGGRAATSGAPIPNFATPEGRGGGARPASVANPPR